MNIYAKTHEHEAPPTDPCFYWATGDGVYLGRNHRFWKSLVPAASSALAPQSPELTLSPDFPRIPAELLERVVGFFELIARASEAEAIVLLAWDDARGYSVHAPPQISLVDTSWAQAVPLSVQYEIPPPPAGSVWLGSIHCHVQMAAYNSPTDTLDTFSFPGLHITVGRLAQEPPEFDCTLAVDHWIFPMAFRDVVGGYGRRDLANIPDAWLQQVTVQHVRRPPASKRRAP